MSERLFVKNAILRSFSRDKNGGKARFSFPFTKDVAEQLGWPQPDHIKSWSPEDADLAAKTVELKANNQDSPVKSMVLDVDSMHDFQIIKKAKKSGKDLVKGKEVITEVFCYVTFAEPTGCAKLEQYKLGAARSEMLVIYDPAPEQQELPGTKVDMTPAGAPGDWKDEKQEKLPGTEDQGDGAEASGDANAAYAKRANERREAKKKRGRGAAAESEPEAEPTTVN